MYWSLRQLTATNDPKPTDRQLTLTLGLMLTVSLFAVSLRRSVDLIRCIALLSTMNQNHVQEVFQCTRGRRVMYKRYERLSSP